MPALSALRRLLRIGGGWLLLLLLHKMHPLLLLLAVAVVAEEMQRLAAADFQNIACRCFDRNAFAAAADKVAADTLVVAAAAVVVVDAVAFRVTRMGRARGLGRSRGCEEKMRKKKAHAKAHKTFKIKTD
jgi:hypothetical protein